MDWTQARREVEFTKRDPPKQKNCKILSEFKIQTTQFLDNLKYLTGSFKLQLN